MPNASPNSGVLLLVIKLYIDLFLPLFLSPPQTSDFVLLEFSSFP